LPVYLFISPHLPIGEDGDIVDGNPNDPRTLEALDQHAPPLYGEHEFDALWDHLDPSGYVPSVGSISSSSGSHRSQNQPPECIGSRDITGSSTFGSGETRDHLHDSPDLSSNFSLSNVHLDSSSHPSQVDGSSIRETLDIHESLGPVPGAHDRDNNPSHSSPLSRSNSTETLLSHTPERAGMDASELSRVPSYTAAIRCTARTPLHNDLPTYFSATGTPLSSPAGTPQLPGQTYVGHERSRSVEVSRSPAPLRRTSHRHTLLNPITTDSSQRETLIQPPSVLSSRATHRSTFVNPVG
jgi:arrestin-related trafficking adapter 4/5/7